MKDKFTSLRQIRALVVDYQVQYLRAGASVETPLPPRDKDEETKSVVEEESKSQEIDPLPATPKQEKALGYFNKILKQKFGLTWTQQEHIVTEPLFTFDAFRDIIKDYADNTRRINCSATTLVFQMIKLVLVEVLSALAAI